MKKAIIYYSMSGNTQYVAKYISNKIDVDLIRLVPKKEYPSEGFKKFFWGGKSAVMGDTPALEEYNFDESKYDYIIFASPVWASTFTPPIRTFIKDNKNKLKDKKFAVIATFSGGGADKMIEKLKKYLDIDNFDAELILIDPKDQKSEEKDKQIDEFCDKLLK